MDRWLRLAPEEARPAVVGSVFDADLEEWLIEAQGALLHRVIEAIEARGWRWMLGANNSAMPGRAAFVDAGEHVVDRDFPVDVSVVEVLLSVYVELLEVVSS